MCKKQTVICLHVCFTHGFTTGFEQTSYSDGYVDPTPRRGWPRLGCFLTTWKLKTFWKRFVAFVGRVQNVDIVPKQGRAVEGRKRRGRRYSHDVVRRRPVSGVHGLGRRISNEHLQRDDQESDVDRRAWNCSGRGQRVHVREQPSEFRVRYVPGTDKFMKYRFSQENHRSRVVDYSCAFKSTCCVSVCLQVG